jgi:ribosome-associated protein
MPEDALEETIDPQAPDALSAAVDTAGVTSEVDLEIAHRIRLAVEAADGRKAIDLKVLKLADVSDFTDYFLVCSGSNIRQVQAIAGAIDKDLRDVGVRPRHEEGLRQGRWVLFDYGDFVVHVFDEDRRHFYRLESLWSDAPDVTDEFLEPTKED